MTQSSTGTTWRSCAAITIAALAALATASGAVAAQPQDAGAAAAGMRRYSDPVDGPRIETRRRAASGQSETSGRDELRSEPVTAPAGGIKLNLRGRYRSALRRAATTDGSARHVCDGPAEGAHAHE